MFGSIKEYLIKTVVLGYLKKALDKIPFDGKKTVLGILVLILGALIKFMPEYAGAFSVLLTLVNSLGPDIITDAGTIGIVTGGVSAITGLIHKMTKKAEKKEVAKARANIRAVE